MKTLASTRLSVKNRDYAEISEQEIDGKNSYY